MRNIFLQKSYTKRDEEASLRTFYKKSKLSISLDEQSEMEYSVFYCICPPKYIKTKVLTRVFVFLGPICRPSAPRPPKFYRYSFKE